MRITSVGIRKFPVTVIAAFLLTSTQLFAVGVPQFTEDFTNNSAMWSNFDQSNVLTHHASGGPGGGAYASGPRSFNGLSAGGTPVTLRANPNNPWNASGDAFVGDWAANGTRNVSAWVRHNAPVDLTYFLRLATPNSQLGFVYFDSNPVPANTWQQISFNLWQGSDQLVSDQGGTPWINLFSLTGYLQFGPVVPASLTADTTAYTFGIDKVTISTPEPTAVVLAIGSMLGLMVMFSRRARTRVEQ